jgi:hypothetical protein
MIKTSMMFPRIQYKSFPAKESRVAVDHMNMGCGMSYSPHLSKLAMHSITHNLRSGGFTRSRADDGSVRA